MDKREPYIAVIFVTALIFFVLEIYYFNYDMFYNMGLGSPWFENTVKKNNFSNTILFSSSLKTKLFILGMVSSAILLSKVKLKLTDKHLRKSKLIPVTFLSAIIYLLIYQFYTIFGNTPSIFITVVVLELIFLLLFIYYLSQLHKLFFSDLLGDRFQRKSRKFEQFKELLINEYSVNIKTEDGIINIVNPFRASQVLGTPGSGKSYSFLIEALIQQIEKGFAMLLYDFKYPDLSLIAYNALQKSKAYKVKPEFCVINFDDLAHSNRCNPIQPDLLNDTTDATKSAQALMYGLYPKWAQKQGDFFVESSINFVASCIWALKNIDDGKYCTIPHLIQFTALDYDSMFKILKEIDDDYINNVIAPFISAYDNDAVDQLEGQIGTTRIALARLTSPYIYWVMTPKEGEGISLQINDPKNPKILCIANNPDKSEVYSPLLSLYNTRAMSLMNKQKMLKSSVMFDELPTLSFPPKSLDTLIATGRSNKIAVWLGFQDFAQLTRDLGKEIAEAIINTVGNTFAGMVNFDTAKKLSEKFGKLKVKKESVTISKETTSVQHSTQMEELIPPSEISSLPQGVFVGQVADDRGFEIDQKIFYSKVLIDHDKRKEYEQGSIPILSKFDTSVQTAISNNFNQIKKDIHDMADLFNQIID